MMPLYASDNNKSISFNIRILEVESLLQLRIEKQQDIFPLYRLLYLYFTTELRFIIKYCTQLVQLGYSTISAPDQVKYVNIPLIYILILGEL